MLPDYDAADPELERLPRGQLDELQSERLREMVRYARSRSSFWRRKVGDAEVDRVVDLPQLPFTSRQELEASQREHPPFGDYTCSPADSWTWLFTTSGTSGRRLRRVFSARDFGYVLDRFARKPLAARGERVMVLGPVDGLLGPTASVEAARRAGALPILAGLWDSRTKVRMIAELRPTVVSGAASYLLHLSDVAHEEGVDLAACGIRRISSVGEPGAAVPATRALLLERYGAERVVDGYGLTELFPLGSSCAKSSALHIAEDLAAVECIDPETGAPVPEGELGELVYTNLVGDTQPVLRYRSGDMGRLQRSAPCACGSTFTRVERIEGRADEMIWYRGVNFFPSAVEQVVRSQPNLAAHGYRIVLDQEGKELPTLTVEVETTASNGAGDVLRRALREALGVEAAVALLAPGSLPRMDGKARRVLDRRAGLR